MSRTVKGYRNQNIFDIAIMLYGTVEGLAEMYINGDIKSFNETVEAKRVYSTRFDNIVNKDVTRYLDSEALIVNTGDLPISGEYERDEYNSDDYLTN